MELCRERCVANVVAFSLAGASPPPAGVDVFSAAAAAPPANIASLAAVAAGAIVLCVYV